MTEREESIEVPWNRDWYNVHKERIVNQGAGWLAAIGVLSPKKYPNQKQIVLIKWQWTEKGWKQRNRYNISKQDHGDVIGSFILDNLEELK